MEVEVGLRDGEVQYTEEEMVERGSPVGLQTRTPSFYKGLRCIEGLRRG